MPSIWVPAATAALSADGSKGYVTVTDSTPFYPGCKAWLYDSDAGSNKLCLITALGASGKVYLRFLQQPQQYRGGPEQPPPVQPGPSWTGYSFHQPNFGGADCTAYTTAKSATLSMPAQLAPIDPEYSKRLAVTG